MLPFSAADLHRAVMDGRVTERKHPVLDLWIYNYAPEIQFTNDWDAVTLNCRGLMLDGDFNVVARPWKKFFNLGQVDLPIQFDTQVEVMDKADGSLGILYPTAYPGHYAIATRGSFTSEQAVHATEVWNREYAEYYNDIMEDDCLDGITVLFEIVYPQNRIVLDYGDMDDLILLGGVTNKEGYYFSPKTTAAMIAWPGPVVETFDYDSISQALSHMDRKNAEGYVIRSHNFMVKLKQPDYLELHRLVTNASPKTVWEQLKAGKTKLEILSAFPDEFKDYISSMIDPLIAKYEDRVHEILDEFYQVLAITEARYGDEPSRKSYAQVFKDYDDVKYFFMLLDNKPIRDVLWTELKPREEVRT